jgi:hypothetical protein
LLFLVVVPVTIVAVIWALASIGGPQARRRYRPGRPFEFAPVWYLANHRSGRHPERTGHRPALTAGSAGAGNGSGAGAGSGGLQGTTGGASDRW